MQRAEAVHLILKYTEGGQAPFLCYHPAGLFETCRWNRSESFIGTDLNR